MKRTDEKVGSTCLDRIECRERTELPKHEAGVYSGLFLCPGLTFWVSTPALSSFPAGNGSSGRAAIAHKSVERARIEVEYERKVEGWGQREHHEEI